MDGWEWEDSGGGFVWPLTSELNEVVRSLIDGLRHEVWEEMAQ